MTDWVGDDGRPKDFVGCTPQEYSRGICGRCGQVGEKMLVVITDETDGFAQLVLTCRECGHGNRWSGNIDTECF